MSTYREPMTEDHPRSPGLLGLRLPLWFVGLMAVITLTLGVGIGVTGALLIARPATATACPESPEVCADFAVFWEAWELASERYVESEAVVPPEMIAGAVNGMLDTLGDEGHTRFLSAEEAEAWDESLRGAFEGIGAYIDERDGQLIIVAPIEGSPAEAAGIRPGDQILAVNGESTAGWSIDELVSRVRGPEGSEVRLQVIHPGETEPVDLTIQRAEVIVPSVSWRLLEDQTALVSVRSFDDDTGDELERALSEAIASGAQAVVLDLRNNPGGLLDEAIQAASQFLPAGTPVLLEENRDGERQVTEARRGGVALDIPLVVLINENSASAAEILSGALQDAGRATLIGVPTFGTGTVLTPYRLSDGSRLLLGTEQWLTPSGRLIRNQGINPDELVDLPLDVAPLSPAEAAELSTQALLENPDVQLVRALELVDQVIGQR